MLKRQMKWWEKHLASLVLWKRSRRAKLIVCVDVPSHGLDKIDQCGYIILKPENICLVDILYLANLLVSASHQLQVLPVALGKTTAAAFISFTSVEEVFAAGCLTKLNRMRWDLDLDRARLKPAKPSSGFTFSNQAKWIVENINGTLWLHIQEDVLLEVFE